MVVCASVLRGSPAKPAWELVARHGYSPATFTASARTTMTDSISGSQSQDSTLSIRFLNIGHLLDHYVILIFPTVVIGLEAVYQTSYGQLLTLSWAAFAAIGIFALPFGWLADH